MESQPDLRKFAARQAKKGGDDTPLGAFLKYRQLLRGYLEMLRDQEDNLRAKLEDRANPLLRSSVWVQKTTGDWARIAGQIQEIERELRGKNSF